MRLIRTSWNSAWWPEEAERQQVAHTPALDGRAVCGLEKNDMVGDGMGAAWQV